jgi:hypothetical protein
MGASHAGIYSTLFYIIYYSMTSIRYSIISTPYYDMLRYHRVHLPLILSNHVLYRKQTVKHVAHLHSTAIQVVTQPTLHCTHHATA